MAQKRKTTRKKRPSLPKRSKSRSTKGKSTSRAKKTNSRSSTRTKANQPQAEKTPNLWASLPLDRKLDIIGVVMAAIGLVTLFGLLSVNNGWLMGGWVTLLGRLFGWGVYFVPIGLILFGGWLILRKFDRLPQLSPERGLGFGLLFMLLLVVMHFALLPEDVDTSRRLAFDGLGGGYLGGGMLQLLQAGLGRAGAAIMLGAIFLLALAITLDKSVAEMFTWISPLILRVQDAWDDFYDRMAARTRGSTSPLVEGTNGFIADCVFGK